MALSLDAPLEDVGDPAGEVGEEGGEDGEGSEQDAGGRPPLSRQLPHSLHSGYNHLLDST